MNFSKIIFISIACLLFLNWISQSVRAEFRFDQKSIEEFFPLLETAGFLTKESEKQFLILHKDGDKILYQRKIIHHNFPLNIFINSQKGIIQDTYLRFPNNFSHDILLSYLQKLFGKQQGYAKKDRTAIYSWSAVDHPKIPNQKIQIIYRGMCSLTCFAMGIHYLPIGKRPGESPNQFEQFYKKSE